MTEEEKNAIEYLKIRLYGNEGCKYIDVAQEDLRIFTNLIEKVQKENEELKNKIMEKELEIIGKEEYTKASMGEIIEQYYTANEECIPVQKVKDKIEKIKQEKKKYGNCLIEMYEDELVNRDIKTLQSLLEESEDSKDGEN